MRVIFHDSIPLNFELTVNGARFRFMGLEPHIKRDGTETALSVWQGCCSECGAEFVARSVAHQFPESRRCPTHKAPGRKAVRA